MSDMAIVDGQLQPLAEAKIAVCDLGFLRGLGAFETLRTYGGHPHALAAHHRRLGDCAAELGFALPVDEPTLRRQLAAVQALMQADGVRELRINLIATPGPHTDGVFGAKQPTWVAICRALHEPPAAWYEQGVAAITFAGKRLLPQFKTTAYLTGKAGLASAEALAAHEAFYRNQHDEVTEGVTSNLLLLEGRRVITPQADCLPGITRQGLAILARAEGLDWCTETIPRTRLLAADEVWISSAVRELLPVVTIDGQSIGSGRPGPWAGRLRSLYRQAAEAESRADALAASP